MDEYEKRFPKNKWDLVPDGEYFILVPKEGTITDIKKIEDFLVAEGYTKDIIDAILEYRPEKLKKYLIDEKIIPMDVFLKGVFDDSIFG